MARKSKVAVEAVVVEASVVEEVITTPEVVEVQEVIIPEVVAPVSELVALLTTTVAPEVLEAKPVVVKNQGVGKFIKELIADGLTNTVILAKVHEEYGNKNTTYACVAWYRNKMKKTAQLVSQSKAVDVVEKFLQADEAVEEVTETVDLIDEEPEGESLMADELRQLVCQ